MRKSIHTDGLGYGWVDKLDSHLHWPRHDLKIIGDGYFIDSGIRIHIVEHLPVAEPQGIMLDNALVMSQEFFEQFYGGFAD